LSSPSSPARGFSGIFAYIHGELVGPACDAGGPWSIWPRIRVSMAKVSPFKFLQEVRSETEKVTWPTRRETMITTLMVFIMVGLAGVYFFVTDQVIRYIITLVLGV
jgi:preprotein translocase subunit SecE